MSAGRVGRRLEILAGVFALALTIGDLHAAGQVTERHTRTLAWSDRHVASLAVTIGRVRIAGEPRQDVWLEVVRHAPGRESLAQVPLTVDEQPDRTSIRVVQLNGARDPALHADVTLRVPSAMAFQSIEIAEGRLELVGLHGRLAADVRRGDIDAEEVSGKVRLETGIGDLVVRRARLTPEGLLRLRTFNGDVRLHLAERPADARIMALALNGTITSDIPLNTKDRWGPRWAEGTFGRGEPVISIDVVNGSIDIRSK